MTPTEINIAIAELRGWRCELWTAGGWCTYDPKGNRQGFAGTREASLMLHAPDYFNDLNACHEMEKVLTYEQQPRYIWGIKRAVMRISPIGAADDYETATATAAQRCEALLRTLGLWREDKGGREE